MGLCSKNDLLLLLPCIFLLLLLFHEFYYVLLFSGVAGEGAGVVVEGSAPITEEAVATPPAGDSKASACIYFIFFCLE